MQAAIFGFGQYSLGPKIEIHSNGILTFELSKGLTKVDIIVKLDRHKSYPMSVCFCLSEGQLSETSNGRSWPNSGGYNTQYLFFSSVCKQIF